MFALVIQEVKRGTVGDEHFAVDLETRVSWPFVLPNKLIVLESALHVRASLKILERKNYWQPQPPPQQPPPPPPENDGPFDDPPLPFAVANTDS